MAEIPSGLLLRLSELFKGRLVGTVYLKKHGISVSALFSNFKPRTINNISYTMSYKHLASDDGAEFFEVNLRKVYPSGVLSGKFFILDFSDSNAVYCFVSSGKSAGIPFLKRGVRSFLEAHFYSSLTRGYLTSENIRFVLKSFSGYLRTNFVASRVSARKMFGKKPNVNIEFEKEPVPFEELFSDMRKKGQWIQWIQLETVHSLSESVHVKFSLSRDGSFDLIRGRLQYFSNLISSIATVSAKSADLFRERALKPKVAPKPLLLEYSEEVFEDMKTRRKLIDSFSQYENCSFSVMHGGNPHVYLYVKDRADQSCYSVRSIGTNKLMITPLFKSNSSALARLVNHLVERFREYDNLVEFQ